MKVKQTATYDRTSIATIPFAIAIIGPGARSLVAGNTIRNVGRQKGGEPPNTADGIGILVLGTSIDALILNNTITLDAPNAKDVPIWVVGGALTIAGYVIPGYMVIASLIYSASTTLIMFMLGRVIVGRVEDKAEVRPSFAMS